MTTTVQSEPRCQWCGSRHASTPCPWVRAIEYHTDGSVKRVEFAKAGLPAIELGQVTDEDMAWAKSDGPTGERGESDCPGYRV